MLWTRFTVDGQSWKGSRIKRCFKMRIGWGDVAAPDIVGLQYSLREETIKTRSITLTRTMMRLFLAGVVSTLVASSIVKKDLI